ncbi:hypothetical protein MP228_006325 [Amoeboaphelidium protococcarum]|nr:hypothetical protein MP228_006325 [Amoeboaphelidium protococcarum]
MKQNNKAFDTLQKTVKDASAEWHQLPQSERVQYQVRAKQLNKQYLDQIVHKVKISQSSNEADGEVTSSSRMSGFTVFIQDEFAKHRERAHHREDGARSIMKEIAAKWREMSPSQKIEYATRAADIRDQAQVVNFPNLGDKTQPVVTSAWQLFVKTHYDEYTDKNIPFAAIVNILADRWKSLDAEQKSVYQRLVKKEGYSTQLSTAHGKATMHNLFGEQKKRKRKGPIVINDYHLFMSQRWKEIMEDRMKDDDYTSSKDAQKFKFAETVKQLAAEWRKQKSKNLS